MQLASLVPRLSPRVNENVLEVTESWAGPGNEASSSHLIGWVRVNLGCCYGNGTYAHKNVCNILTNRDTALIRAAGYISPC